MYRRSRLIGQQAGHSSNRQSIMFIHMYRPIGAMLHHAIGFHKTGACCKSQQLQKAMHNQTGVGMQGVLESKSQVFGCLLAVPDGLQSTEVRGKNKKCTHVL